jgi:hypothetical protein
MIALRQPHPRPAGSRCVHEQLEYPNAQIPKQLRRFSPLLVGCLK